MNGPGQDMRRIIRVSRLLAELHHSDVIDALEELKALRAAEPDLTALRRGVWNAAIEAAAMVVQPVPHVEEERTCGEVAAAIRALAAVGAVGKRALLLPVPSLAASDSPTKHSTESTKKSAAMDALIADSQAMGAYGETNG